MKIIQAQSAHIIFLVLPGNVCFVRRTTSSF